MPTDCKECGNRAEHVGDVAHHSQASAGSEECIILIAPGSALPASQTSSSRWHSNPAAIAKPFDSCAPPLSAPGWRLLAYRPWRPSLNHRPGRWAGLPVRPPQGWKSGREFYRKPSHALSVSFDHYRRRPWRRCVAGTLRPGIGLGSDDSSSGRVEVGKGQRHPRGCADRDGAMHGFAVGAKLAVASMPGQCLQLDGLTARTSPAR